VIQVDDAFRTLGSFSDEEIDALIKIAGGIPDTLVKEKIGETICSQSRHDAARAILNYASRNSTGTTIRIDGKELSRTKQEHVLNSIKKKSKLLSRDIQNVWCRDNWNLSCHFAKHGIREEFERLIYLLDNVHHAAESALQDLEPIRKKEELTNAQKESRAEFMAAIFKVWENIFEQEITLQRTSETMKTKGGRPTGRLVKFILKASEIANLKPRLNAEAAATEIKKRQKEKSLKSK